MNSGKRASILRRTLAAFLLAAPVQAGDLSKFPVPAPLTSAQFERVLQEAHLPASERHAAEAAFDTYVEEWQRLRDRTLRPLAEQVSNTTAQMAKDSVANSRSMQGQQSAERSPEQVKAEEEAFIRQRDAVEATKAELRTKARQGFERISQLDARLFAALRAGPRSDEQSKVIDALALDRARRLAAAMIRSNGAHERTALLSRLPAAPKAIDAAAATAFTERLARLDRESLPPLQRIATAALAPDDATASTQADVDKLVRLRMKAIDELGTMLPADVGARWVESARGRMLGTLLWSAPTAPRAAIEEAIGDRLDAAARKRLDRWTAERRAIEDELLLGSDDWKFTSKRTETLKALDRQAMTDLADSTRTPALTEEEFSMNARMQAAREDGASGFGGMFDDEDNAMLGMQRRMQARMQAAQESVGGAPTEATAAADPAMAAMRQRGLQRVQVDRIRDGLGIAANRMAVWDALAADVLDASERLHQEKSIQPSEMNGPPQQAMQALLRTGEYRTEQQALEDRWFDSIAAALPEVSKATLADQRSRRALQRLRDLGVLARMVSAMSGDRTSDLDLDAVTDRLPAEARAQILPQILASRERRVRDLQASIDAAETLVRAMAKLSNGVEPGTTPDPESLNSLMEEQQRFGVGAQKRAEQAKVAHREEIEAMAAALPKSAATALRRMVRAQEFPEVYRDMERMDQSIERAISLPDLSTEQIAAMGGEAEAYRVRSDEIAERAIAALAQAESAQLQLVTATGGGSDPQGQMERFANMTRSETAHADLEFDRSELAARTLRHLRALLTPEQARMAGLLTTP